MATSTTMPKGKYTESLTFSTPNGIYANYGKLGKPSLHPGTKRWSHQGGVGSVISSLDAPWFWTTKAHHFYCG